MLPTDFNRGRSDVKYLEYASNGVVGVYPDLEPYRGSVIADETGLVYRNEEELLGHLDRLTVDAEWRLRIRDNAYHAVTSARRLADHVHTRFKFYQQLLSAVKHQPEASARHSAPLQPAVLAAAVVVEGRYFQLRPGEPELILQQSKQGPARAESIQALTRVLATHPEYLLAYQQVGKLHNDLRDPASASRYLEHALKLDPNSARTLCELGRSQFLRGDIGGGRKLLESGLTLNPGYQLGWQYLLRLLSLHGSADGPAWAERARQAHPRNVYLALLAAKVESGANCLRASINGSTSSRAISASKKDRRLRWYLGKRCPT